MTGYPIKQEYYTIVTSITASLIALGFCGSIWLFAKMTKNILLYTSLNTAITVTLPNISKNWSRMTLSQYMLIILSLIGLCIGSVDVLFNIQSIIYVSAGVRKDYSNKFVPSLGPLPYLNPGSISAYKSLRPDSTNSVPYSAIAALFKESYILDVNDEYKDDFHPFSIDASCDLISNILVNTPASISAEMHEDVDYDLFGEKMWNIPQDDTMVSAVWAMGPQVSSLINPDPKTIMVLSQVSFATNNSKQYDPLTTQIWLPIVSSASLGSAYIYSEGKRGRNRNCSNDSPPCDPFYFDPGPPSNDTLIVNLVEVMNISFGNIDFTKGPAVACYTYYYVDGQDARCIVNIRQDDYGFILYDVLVMLNSKFKNYDAIEKHLIAPYSYIYPIAAPIYLNYSQKSHDIVVTAGKYCDSVFFFDSKLCAKDYQDIRYGENSNLGISQMAMNYSYSYTVNLSTNSIKLYDKPSKNIDFLTSLVAGMNPLSGNCAAAFANTTKNATFVDSSKRFPTGTLFVFVEISLMVTIILLALFGFGLFWYNDYYTMVLTYIGNDFGGFTPENTLLSSWIGVAKREDGWRPEVLTAKHAPKKTMICESFKKAEIEAYKLNNDQSYYDKIVASANMQALQNRSPPHIVQSLEMDANGQNQQLPPGQSRLPPHIMQSMNAHRQNQQPPPAYPSSPNGPMFDE